MAMVGEPDMSMFSLANVHSQHHSLLDWNAGEQVGSFSRGMAQNDDLDSSMFISIAQSFNPEQSYLSGLSSAHAPPFELNDNYIHGMKVEPATGNLSDFGGLFNQPSHQQGSYSHIPNQAHNHMTQPQLHHRQQGYGNQSVSQQQQERFCTPHPVYDDDLPWSLGGQQIQQGGVDDHGLEMDPMIYGQMITMPLLPPPQQAFLQTELGVGNFQDMHGDTGNQQWTMQQNRAIHNRAAILAKELQEQIMSDNSSSMDTRSSSSECSPMTYGGASEGAASEGAMSSFYPDGPRGHPGLPQALTVVGNNGGLRTSSSVIQPQQNPLVIDSWMMETGPAGSGVGNAFPQDPNYFLPRPLNYCPNNTPPVVLQQPQQQAARLSSSVPPHGIAGAGPLGALVEHGAPGAVVPVSGLQLVHLLLSCAEAVADDQRETAERILVQLRRHVVPEGTPMQRLAAYFEQALTARLTRNSGASIFLGLTGDNRSRPQAEVLEAFSVFYDCIPIGKFGHLTCNQILLDAVERDKVVHVLDLHVWHGMQWPAFLQALALRPGGPPKLRMSAVGADMEDLKETGEKLTECAKNLSVPFEFCAICVSLEDFDADSVEIRRGEVLVVNSFVQFHGILNKGPNCLNNLLAGLRRLNPRVMAFAENDASHNSPIFLSRFVECLRYYSAVFDAFDASLPADSPARMKMEEIFAAQKIRNIIACEGPARVDGHETMKFWHKRMEAAHFRNRSLSTRAVSQANLLLNLYYNNGYSLNSIECGYLAVGWHGMPLMGVSAWH